MHIPLLIPNHYLYPLAKVFLSKPAEPNNATRQWGRPTTKTQQTQTQTLPKSPSILVGQIAQRYNHFSKVDNGTPFSNPKSQVRSAALSTPALPIRGQGTT
ncbi:hypothetical protein D9758_018398 [Tetrapyrgos nigripes]|uniref:Uncharacterized protein n=1 Tax=Tetrapyrgos nigripes TaxID=182062 RepID=A0A8H5F9L8_9AGAR|nr:hypothetical protein D9758_018398 [Tetrapyrgos nigripes]